jgi:type VI secretion system secreted protein Hcp
MKRCNGVAVWAAVIGAVAVLALMVSSKAPGGLLEPTDAPAPTMHTLDEIYANTRSIVEPPEALATARGPAYLFVDGIQGGVPKGPHGGWIEIFNFANDLELVGDYSGGGGAARVQIADFVVTKQLDKSSPKLAVACCKGQQIAQATIEWVSPVNDSDVWYRVRLQDVLVRRISPRLVNRGDGLVMMEEVALVFGKITWEYLGTGGPIVSYWDVKLNQGG